MSPYRDPFIFIAYTSDTEGGIFGINNIGQPLYFEFNQKYDSLGVFIDINGVSKPNTLGRDVFWIPFNNRGAVKCPNSKDYYKSNCSEAEYKTDPYCACYLIKNNYEMDY